MSSKADTADTKSSKSGSTEKAGPETLNVELRDPPLAAFLAWLIPGGGHIYQGRTAKGLMFMVCIVGTFLYGFYLGGGKVVYAAWNPEDHRWAYPCQLGAGLMAMPALVQAQRARTGKKTFLWGGLMAPPQQGELKDWHRRLHRYFELGTAYTMIAGLLNILVIYDAYAGPMVILPSTRRRKERDGPRDKGGGDDAAGKGSPGGKGSPDGEGQP